jgi:leucyl-tRNA synthetase
MVKINGEVMSKSKGNAVAPEDIIERFGADSLRVYILFMAPPDKDLDWSQESLEGIYRFMNRVWRSVFDLTGEEVIDDEGVRLSVYDSSIDVAAATQRGKELYREMHRVIGKVTADIERFNFNTAISAIMELLNAISSYLKVPLDLRDAALAKEVARALVLLLSPLAPHMTEELWRTALGETQSVHLQEWPKHDPKQAVADTIELAVQVNGKVRARVTVAVDATDDEVQEAALAEAKLFIGDNQVKKLVVVPGKLVSIVV